MREQVLSPQLEGGADVAFAAPAGSARGRSSTLLKIDTHPAGDRVVVVAAGEIDIDTDQVLQHGLREALTRSVRGVDLDLSGVEFCDCSGLNVLLHIRRLALENAKTLNIRSVGPAVARLLALTHTSSLFAFVPVSTAHDAAPGDALREEAEDDLRIEVVQLKRAMQTRPVIDMARGVLMASFGLNATDAWSVLVAVSQHTNIKLHHLAQDLVSAVTGAPLPDPLRQHLAAAVTEVVGPGARCPGT
jgi:anti-anti-sigma factor